MTTDEARRRELRFSAIVFFVALLPRLYVAIAWAKEPVWDGHYYDFGARRIAEGFGYSDDVVIGGVLRWHPWCHYPVGYSALLALVYVIFGAGPKVATVTNAVLGALLAVIVHRAGLLALSPWRARAAALLTALSPELIVYAALLMTEPAASIAPVLAALLAARDRTTRPLRGALLAGVVLGIGTLIRPQTVLGAPALLLLAIDPSDLRRSLRRGVAVTTVATAACLLTVAPWTVRNCRVMDGCAFVSTNAGWNLAIGSFERATGRFETLRATDGCPVVTGQVQQDRCWAKVGVDNIVSSPARWLALVPKKLSFTFDHASFPMGYLGEADPQRFDEPTKAKGRELLTATHRALLAGALFAGVAACWVIGDTRRRWIQAGLAIAVATLVVFVATRDEPRPYWWLAVITPILAALPFPGRAPLGPVLRYLLATYAAVTVTHAVFFGEDRYHVFVTPILALLVAAGFRRLEGDAPGTTTLDPVGPDLASPLRASDHREVESPGVTPLEGDPHPTKL